MKIKIDDVKFIKELYPRFELDNYVVNQYRQSIETLPPIVLSKNMILVDGYHRLIAHRLEEKSEIEAEILDIDDEKEIFLEAIARNSSHGKQLQIEEKAKLAPKLYSMNVSLEEISRILAISKTKIYDWTQSLREREKEQRDVEVLDLYLQCWTQEQIAEKIELSQMAISKILNKTISTNGESFTPDNLQLYNLR